MTYYFESQPLTAEMLARRTECVHGSMRPQLVREAISDCPGATEADVVEVYDTVAAQVGADRAFTNRPEIFATSVFYPALHAATTDQVCRRVIGDRRRYLAAHADALLVRFLNTFPWLDPQRARAAWGRMDRNAITDCYLFCTDVERFVEEFFMDFWLNEAFKELRCNE